MPQHDGVIDNQAGAAFRADLNNFILAIIANSSGATAPATTYAYQWWADTTTGLLKIRNAANSAWITIGTLADAYLGLLPLSGGTLTGLLTFKKGADIASATTVDLTAATGNLIHITGTTPTTGLTMNSGQLVVLIADGAWPLTYHATNLKLNSGGVDKTLAAGDQVWCWYDGTTKYAFIIKADGTAVVASSSGWDFTSSEIALTTSTNHSAAHGLGAEPKNFMAVARCKTADIGFSVGDVVILGSSDNGAGVECQVYCNATNVYFTLDAGGIVLVNPSTFANSAITLASWKLELRAKLT